MGTIEQRQEEYEQEKAEKDEPLACPVERRVIRQFLEGEIKALDKSIERLEKVDSLDAAAYKSAKRDGVSWALFVLSVKLGV